MDARTECDEAADAEARFRVAFERSPIGTSLVAATGRFLHVNAAMCAITGYSPEELLARTFQEITHPDDVDADVASAAQLWHGEIDHYDMEKRYLRNDGAAIWVLLHVTVVRGDGGTPSYFMSHIQDISARRRATEELGRERDVLRTLMDNLPDQIYVKDAAGRFLQVNRAQARYLGYDDPKALIGKTDFDFYPAELAAEFRADEERLLASGDAVVNKLERQSAEGQTQRWTLTTKSPVRDSSGRVIGLIGTSRDVTERQNAEETLRLAKETAEEVSRLKSEFLSRISHELRTPMNGIIGYAHMLIDGLSGDLTEEQARDVGQIIASADQLMAMIDDMLDLAALDAGRLRLAAERVDIGEAVRRVVDVVRPAAEAKRLAMTIDVAHDQPAATGDARRLDQILRVLIGNAVKFTDCGGIAIAVRATASTSLVTIDDTGVGIAPDALAIVFDEFRQADGSDTRRFGGAGIGLAIARKLARLHGGDITVTSAPGVGSTFQLRLPTARAR